MRNVVEERPGDRLALGLAGYARLHVQKARFGPKWTEYRRDTLGIGDPGWNLKSPFSGSTKSGSAARLCASTPSLCCFFSSALPNARSAAQ